ncbi:S8 family peptidase [Candidatus Uabimicrobium amorphum]|uniref:Serine protease n=1 Tax=Uabimicrobium amorphum TaxID=2596890 RepID=A0A5S9IRI4_UABAM|nr:S8 family serine peptidase [Candidatus Uabimicrobium amorphum]BBM86574.1 serine protease [Candidatus Uabimicrobium amorphum]
MKKFKRLIIAICVGITILFARCFMPKANGITVIWENGIKNTKKYSEGKDILNKHNFFISTSSSRDDSDIFIFKGKDYYQSYSDALIKLKEKNLILWAIPKELSNITPKKNKIIASYHKTSRIDKAWEEYEVTGKGINIAIMSDGVDVGHPDLASHIFTNTEEKFDNKDSDKNGVADDVFGYNFIDDNPHTTPKKVGNSPLIKKLGLYDNQGTMSAGIISAIASNSKIVPIKIFSGKKGQSFSENIVIKAVNYASKLKNVKIIVMPWGMSSENVRLKDLIQTIQKKYNTIFICPAGNTKNKVLFPANMKETIAVGMVESNIKPGDQHVDIYAPGKNIPTTNPRYSSSNNDEESLLYTNYSGSCAASCIVGGIVALMCEKNPHLDVHMVQEILKSTSSNGIVDAKAAIAKVVKDLRKSNK